MSNAYEIISLSKKYPGPKGVLANDDITLSVKTGEILGIFGPNGAGKTTLVRQLMALSRPTSGTITLFGMDIVRHPDHVPWKVAYFGQETYYFWYQTPREFLYITGRLRGLSSKEAKKHSRFLLEKFNFGNKMDSTLARLSHGEATIASLLSVFMSRRPVLILDEPTAKLDPVRRKEFWDYLWEINTEYEITVILVTHNVFEAEKVVHRVAIIDSGKLIAIGTPSELKKDIGEFVRVEVQLAEGINLTSSIDHCIQLPSKRNTLLFQTSKASVDLVTKEVLQKVGIDNVVDLKIVTPTLEDVYIKTVGKEWK